MNQDNQPTKLTHDIIHAWADDPKGPVALHLKQKLVSVEEGDHTVIFPPTYADIGYNIDTLSDGTKVATIDSVGSQANRIEPIFKSEPFSELVPQINVEIAVKPNKNSKDEQPFTVIRSLLDLAHRSADATVQACPTLGPEIRKAFNILNRKDDAGPLCRIAPTSLLFGVWDSRGGSGEKRPRLVRSIIRAWDVDLLHSAAQFNSIRKVLDEETLTALKNEAKSKKKKLSDIGLDDAPAVFRGLKDKAAKEIPEYKNGYPNPERRTLGGILVHGAVERCVSVNLVALRRLKGQGEETQALRRYLLSLALIAATADLDLYLREGCNLRYAGPDIWQMVPRRGNTVSVDLVSEKSAQTIFEYAKKSAEVFKTLFDGATREGFNNEWAQKVEQQSHKFDLAAAKKLIAKAEAEEAGGE